MASDTISDDERSFSQSSGSGDRAKSVPQQPVSEKDSEQANGEEIGSSRPMSAAPGASCHSQSMGDAADVEKARRQAKHRDRYQAFLASAEQRRLARKELEVRNKVWQESKDKAQARIETLDRERLSILEKLKAMEAAKDSYNARNAVHVSGDQDQETRRKWEAYLNLETDVMEV